MNAKELLRKIPLSFTHLQTEASLVQVFLEQNGFSATTPNLQELVQKAEPSICGLLRTLPPLTITMIKSILEEMVSLHERGKNGVIFTPEYIANYILEQTISSPCPQSCRLIDPACGSGSFLLPAAIHLHRVLKIPMKEILSKHLYGIDISADQTRRTQLLLTLLALQVDKSAEGLQFHLATADSLDCNWPQLFGCNDFDYIVGNPPYINTHTIPKEESERLKRSFRTTRRGTFNLFYAFIEQSLHFLSEQGSIGFIVPNNYLSISSAQELRKLLGERRAVSKVIDFGENLVFEPVHTYSSLLFLNKQENRTVSYAKLKKSSDIPAVLSSTVPYQTDAMHLHPTGWKFLSKTEQENIQKIEQAGDSIQKQIRIGIATLRDHVYFLDGYDSAAGYYYKQRGRTRYYMEPDVVKPINKISEITDAASLVKVRQHILFPYSGDNDPKTPYRILGEEELAARYPLCYQYLLDCRPVLAARDKGKPNPVAWYAYGRSQGLNCRVPKLLLPMFSRRPKFLMEADGEILFCNGYAIADGGRYPLAVLQTILNSGVMEYYISRVSYSLRGDYKCYQKKYLKHFSIPELNESEIGFLLSCSNVEELNTFLFQKYNLVL